MLTRLLSAAVAIPIALAIIYWDGWMLFLFVTGLALIGLEELYATYSTVEVHPPRGAAFVGAVLYLAAIEFARRQSQSLLLHLALTVVVLGALSGKVVRKQRSRALPDLGACLFGFVYVVVLSSYALRLRQIARPYAGEGLLGKFGDQTAALLLPLLCTWATDSGAYFVGRAVGKVKLLPELSPGKTVEGALAGFVCSIVVGTLAAVALGLPGYHGLCLGTLLGVVAQLGDLAESLIKRNLGVKDLGTLFPGHGGVLDRLDSLLFVLPITYFYFNAFVV